MKTIARRARRDINSHFVHIIVQGIEKQYIFEKEIFKQKYLSLLKENIEEYLAWDKIYAVGGSSFTEEALLASESGAKKR